MAANAPAWPAAALLDLPAKTIGGIADELESALHAHSPNAAAHANLRNLTAKVSWRSYASP
jgi:hypothetical protein